MTGRGPRSTQAGAPRLRAVSGLLAATLTGCDAYAPYQRGLFPVQVSLVLAYESGRRESLLLDLKRNHEDQLDLRMADGAVLHDGQHVWQIEDEGGRIFALDRVSGTRRTLAARGELIAWDHRHAWFKAPGTQGRASDCSLLTGRCAPGVPGAAPISHPGPADGFTLTLKHGALRLRLPLEDEPADDVLAEGVAQIIGAHWVKQVRPQNRDLLDQVFRGRARLLARTRAVMVDGRLEDWAGAAPLVVGSAWHLEPGGLDAWAGPEDASFSIAAAVRGTDLCFGTRIRDDHFADGDVLSFRVGDEARELAVREALQGPDEAVTTDWFDRSAELCLSPPPGRSLPLAVFYTDVDPDGTSVLASAPIDHGAPRGTVTLVP